MALFARCFPAPFSAPVCRELPMMCWLIGIPSVLAQDSGASARGLQRPMRDQMAHSKAHAMNNNFPVCSNRFIASLRWLARLTGLGIVGLVVLFLAGTGGFNPTKLSRSESAQMFLFLVTCLGLLVAWR